MLFSVCRDERYTLTFTPPSQPSSSGRGLDWDLLNPLRAGQRKGGGGGGGVRVSLRSDASAEDVVLALLHAAYLRRAVLQGPARPLPRSMAGGGAEPLALAAAAAAGAEGGREDGSGGLDGGAMVRESRDAARRGLRPFLSGLEAEGWQVAPFMLSSIEKRTYVLLER